MELNSFGAGMSVVVVGASGGVGCALTRLLSASARVARITACSRSGSMPADAKVRHLRLDLEDETTIARAAEALRAEASALDLVFIASGILHDDKVLRPERTWRALDGAALERVYRINAVGPALVAKHFLPLLARDRKSVFAALSARVGSISDNRSGGWHAYRAVEGSAKHAASDALDRVDTSEPASGLCRASPGHRRHRPLRTLSGELARGQAVHSRVCRRASA
jgi:NAD(P)-dependent dehydrogenase (short-subunit alcohol dehydrogenase family)